MEVIVDASDQGHLEEERGAVPKEEIGLGQPVVEVLMRAVAHRPVLREVPRDPLQQGGFGHDTRVQGTSKA